LENIFSMQAFVDQVNKLLLDDLTSSNRNAIVQAIKNTLNSPLLPESTSKYWTLIPSQHDSANPYNFKLSSKCSWPVNLLITQTFLGNLAGSLQLINRIFYQYVSFRTRTVSCVLNLSNGHSIKFPRRTQNFVLSFRQLLYRLFNCLVKKIGTDIRELQQIVRSSGSFNDLEANVKQWHEKIHRFINESTSVSAIISLCNCAQNFLECFDQVNYLEQSDASYANRSSTSMMSHVHDLDVLTLEIRQEFVMSCESLNLSPLESSILELTPFEKELSLIVVHITLDKFLQL